MFHCLWFLYRAPWRHQPRSHVFSNNRHCPQISPIQRTFDRNCKVHWLRFLGGSWKWWRMVAVYAWSTSRRWAKVTLEEFIDGIMRCKGQAHLWQRRVISRREFWCCFVVFWNISTQVVCEMAFIEQLSLTGYSGFSWGTKWRFCDAGQHVFQSDHFFNPPNWTKKASINRFSVMGVEPFCFHVVLISCVINPERSFSKIFGAMFGIGTNWRCFSLQKDGSFCQLAQNFQIYSWGNHAWFFFISSQPSKNEDNVVLSTKNTTMSTWSKVDTSIPFVVFFNF